MLGKRVNTQNKNLKHALQNWSKTCFAKFGEASDGCALFEVDRVKALYMNTSMLCYVPKVLRAST